jgi:hypothetical protein
VALEEDYMYSDPSTAPIRIRQLSDTRHQWMATDPANSLTPSGKHSPLNGVLWPPVTHCIWRCSNCDTLDGGPGTPHTFILIRKHIWTSLPVGPNHMSAATFRSCLSSGTIQWKMVSEPNMRWDRHMQRRGNKCIQDIGGGGGNLPEETAQMAIGQWGG